LRKAFGADRKLIRTVTGRGYRAAESTLLISATSPLLSNAYCVVQA
jgi:DNA-binding winged helix-turn-helix (wHTH) protein